MSRYIYIGKHFSLAWWWFYINFLRWQINAITLSVIYKYYFLKSFSIIKAFIFCGLLIYLPSQISYTLFIIFFILFLLNFSLPTLLFFPGLDFYSLRLIFLTLWLVIFIGKANFFARHRAILIFSFSALVIFLRFRFLSQSLLLFYLFFEASLIPIFWIIMTWGYQPERLLARLIIFFYTLASSFPLLALILILWNYSFSLIMYFVFSCIPVISTWVRLAAMLAFLVKFPVYAAHIWLPKAHVEAPVAGSIILAGVLLKLGGYGLYRISILFSISVSSLIWAVVASLGGSLLRIFCCRATDIKILIAYSSVVHISLIIVNLLLLRKVGLLGAWWVIIAHGVVSSGIFAMANILYERTHSRSMLVNKGHRSNAPGFMIFWFFIIIINFAGPFTLNLLGELYLIIGVLAISKLLLIPVAFLSFFSAAYSLLLFTTTQHGLPQSSNILMVSSTNRELSLILGHVWPIIIILLRLGV